ncbi:MAG: cytochrome P450 [Acidobacteria bacterium]|nr:cytochrome P450 [Acidobacteriota bacterium]
MDIPLKPPGPKGYLLIRKLLEFDRDPLNFLLHFTREYGDLVYLGAFGLRFYLFNHPDLIEYVLVTNNRNFIKDKGLRISSLRKIFGNGLLTSEGEFWIRQRRLAQPAFHREKIAAYGDVMVESTERMINNWRPGEVRDIHQEMMHLTLEIVVKTLFGARTLIEKQDVAEAIEVISRYFSSQSAYILPISFLPTPAQIRLGRAIKKLDRIIHQIIRERRESGDEQEDLLSLLLEAQDDDGSRMTDRQLRDEVMTLFLAGHETTALSLSWTWYLLALHPEIERKLVAELKETLNGRSATVADLSRLSYLEMVVKESMRLYPPAWILGREALQGFEINGYSIPGGAQVSMSPWLMHRDQRYFDQPDEFRPERWASEQIKLLPKYAYFPFGGGPRLCIGNSFALMEAKLILATIAQKFHLDLVPDQTVRPLPSITLRPKNGIKVILARSWKDQTGKCRTGK